MGTEVGGGEREEEGSREKRGREGLGEREYVGIQLAFSFLFTLGPQLTGQCFPHSGWIFPPLFNLTENFADTPRGMFPWRSQVQLSRPNDNGMSQPVMTVYDLGMGSGD